MDKEDFKAVADETIDMLGNLGNQFGDILDEERIIPDMITKLLFTKTASVYLSSIARDTDVPKHVLNDEELRDHIDTKFIHELFGTNLPPSDIKELINKARSEVEEEKQTDLSDTHLVEIDPEKFDGDDDSHEGLDLSDAIKNDPTTS